MQEFVSGSGCRGAGRAIRGLSVWLAVAMATPAAAATGGAITGIAATPDGGAVVSGWVCQTAGTPVRLSVGGPRATGQPIAEVTADRPAPAGAGPCASGAAAGFAAALPRATLFRYGELPLSAAVAGAALAGGGPLPAWRAQPGGARACNIGDMDSLRACFAYPEAYDRFVFTADVTCAGSACCKEADRPPMELLNARGKTIEGNGHVLRRRQGGQYACPALLVLKSEDIAVERLGFDDDAGQPACELSTKPCASTVRIQSARNVRLSGVKVEAGKGYVVNVWDTDGFAFVRSAVVDAGIIGLYVGHYKYGPSRNLVVAQSAITRSRTNALALQGAEAAGPDAPVLVMDSVFRGNHWHGLWPVANVPGGITTGGQVLVADGHGIRITGNVIANGACGNCKPPGQTVAAIEIADQAPPPAGVAGLTIDHNELLDGTGTAIIQNPGTTVPGVAILDNRLTGFAALDRGIGAARRAGNSLAR